MEYSRELWLSIPSQTSTLLTKTCSCIPIRSVRKNPPTIDPKLLVEPIRSTCRHRSGSRHPRASQLTAKNKRSNPSARGTGRGNSDPVGVVSATLLAYCVYQSSVSSYLPSLVDFYARKMAISMKRCSCTVRMG